MNNYLHLAHSSIKDLKPYQPGKPISEVKRELGLETVIKLASNENPLGPGEKAIAAGLDALKQAHVYPDGAAFELKHALAELHGVKPNQITITNGSDQVFSLLVQAFASNGEEVIYSQYSFIAYQLFAKAHGATPIEIPAEDFGYDLTAIRQHINAKSRIVFIANPNNPTGTWCTKAALQEFLERIPDECFVVLDEAYFEYMQDEDYVSGIEFLNYKNVIVTRTFSKLYALGGLRIGYAISHPDVADILNRVRSPFNVNAVAQASAKAALTDEAHINASIKTNTLGTAQLTEAFKHLGLAYLAPQGNFITVNFQDKADFVFNELLKNGIIVRGLKPYQLDNYLRITIGTEPQNQLLINTLKSIL